MRRRWVPLLALVACADEPITPLDTSDVGLPRLPEEMCSAIDPDRPTSFAPCSRGSGSFGRWTLDEAGLPAYAYGIDQYAEDIALYRNSENAPWRSHWAAIGNHRVNGMFSNDGTLELVTQDRGVEYLNKIDEEQGWFGGGFSYLDDGDVAFATAFKYRPDGAQTRRVFGMGYAESSTTYAQLEVTRRSYAPWGDAPYILDEVSITNHTEDIKTLAHYEVFDVARRSIDINWLVSGDPVSAAPPTSRQLRDEQNGRFLESVSYDASSKTLAMQRRHAPGITPIAREAPSPTNDYPADPFLAVLVGDVSDTFTTDALFFGEGDVAAPTAVTERRKGEGIETGPRSVTVGGEGQGRMFAVRSDLAIGPGQTKRLRFAYGYAPMGSPVVIDPRHAEPQFDGLAEYRKELGERLVYFDAEGADPALHRELAWHAYQIEASVGRRDYFEGPVVPQGSAYLYLHGADGAARDLGIFSVPLTYVDPDLARAELELYMRVQFAEDERFSYAFQGHGMLDDAQGIHHAPSDLDLFFVWALGEYVGATGDTFFLDRKVPFWPREARPDATSWDHLAAALNHLFEVVGTGEHGLIRVGTGDWSDGIVIESPNRDLAIEAGESVPNTQMAIAVLPRIADLVEERDPALAETIREHVDGYRQALASAWGGSFYGRAFYGDGVLVRKDRMDLEAQVWALIGGTFASEADRGSALAAIHDQLDLPSPAGATLQPDGQVWPAISGLLTDGYARTRPDWAWEHLQRNTMFAHALSYPDVWYGIWSGPDGLNGPSGDRPGEAWFSLATPMTDFPVQNNNQHAMPLYATIRLAGIEATADGLRIEPRLPPERFTLKTRLVSIAREPGKLSIRYAPPGNGHRRVEVVVPEGATGALLDGSPQTIEPGANSVSFFIIADGQGTAHDLEIRYGAAAQK